MRPHLVLAGKQSRALTSYEASTIHSRGMCRICHDEEETLSVVSRLQHYIETKVEMRCALEMVSLVYDVVRCTYLANDMNTVHRKMDMLSADMALQEEEAASKRKGRGKGKGRGNGKSKSKSKDVEQAALHFTALMPVGESVWKLDGLERQPGNLGQSPNAKSSDLFS